MFCIMAQLETRILVSKNVTASCDIILISSHNQECQIYVLEPTSYMLLVS